MILYPFLSLFLHTRCSFLIINKNIYVSEDKALHTDTNQSEDSAL